MSKPNINNEVIKRKYFKWLKEAEGFSESTINCIEKAILLYEEFTEHKDFTTFNSNKAIEYKNWLKNKKHKGKTISITTCFANLRHLRKFFTWLCGQAGFKSKIKPDSVQYLHITDKEERMATQNIPRKYPSFDEVKKVINSIEINHEIDQRDRALISFTALTGMRDKAIITLPLGCFDSENLIIQQDPKQGVQTKFSKYITSIMFKFDESLVRYVIDWVDYLKSKDFNVDDPLFPRNKIKQGNDNLSFETSDEVEPTFWKDTGRMRKIFEKWFKNAGLPYYPPHTFRHMVTEFAWKHCKNGFEMKAVSQHFGHENIATTFGSYANCEPQKLTEILNNLDFSEEPQIENDKKEKIKEIVNILKTF